MSLGGASLVTDRTQKPRGQGPGRLRVHLIPVPSTEGRGDAEERSNEEVGCCSSGCGPLRHGLRRYASAPPT